MFFDDLEIGMTVDIDAAVIEKEKMMDFARLYDNDVTEAIVKCSQ